MSEIGQEEKDSSSASEKESNIEKWSQHETETEASSHFPNTFSASVMRILQFSSIHGFASIFRTKKIFMKVFWLMFFTISSTLCTWFTIQIFTQYLSYKVITNVKYVNEIPAEFPRITICNKNPLVSIYGYQLTADIYQRLYGSNLDDKKDSTNLDDLLEKVKLAVNNKKYSKEEKQQWGHSFNQMFLKCTFSEAPCNESDFEWMYSPDYGNCYVFNSGKISMKKVYNAGSKYGLNLDLFVGMHEPWEKFYDSTGAVLMINNQTYVSKKSNEILVSTGVQTKISISRTHVYQKPAPYSECSFDAHTKGFISPMYDSLINAKYSYSQQDCIYQCLQHEIETECDCFNPEFIPLLKEFSCFDSNNHTKTLKNILCYKNVTESFFKNVTGKCKQMCPLECHRAFYTHASLVSDSLSRKKVELDYANNTILTKTLRDLSLDKLKQSIVKLSIFYDELRYTEIVESERMTLVDLLSGLGGVLGLFLGASLLSFLEIAEIIAELLMALFCKNKKSTKVSFKNF